MTNTAASSTVAVMTGRSDVTTEVTDSCPTPARSKTGSMMIAPPSRPARSRPAEVTIGVRPARKRVLADDRALLQALGPRGADEVLAQRLEHLVAGEPGVEGGVEQGDGDPGQDASPWNQSQGSCQNGT